MSDPLARARLRQVVERGVEVLIAILDEIDGDPEFEPSLGFVEPYAVLGTMASAQGLDQSKPDCATLDLEVEGDDEPDGRDLPVDCGGPRRPIFGGQCF